MMSAVRLVFLLSAIVLGSVTCRGNITNVVQREGCETTFTCLVPTQWTACTFQHHDGGQGQCSVGNQGEVIQNCGAFGQGAQLWAGDGACQLVLKSVTGDHNGTWSCTFEQDITQSGYNIYEGTKGSSTFRNLGDFARDFTLMILHEPSSITVSPQEGTVTSYNLLEPFDATISIENVAPKPRVEWTMDGRSIDGLYTQNTNVNYVAQYMAVVKHFSIWNGKESFDGKHLQYRLTLEVVDEYGDSTVEFVKEGEIKLICNNCDNTTTASTTTLSTSSSTAPTISIIDTTTLPTSPTTQPSPVDCNFNLTQMSGPLIYPGPCTDCNLDPSPTWTISINCNGNCINIININFNKMSCGDSPCQTRLNVTTLTGDGNRQIHFNESTPLQMSFNDSQVILEFDNILAESDVSFEGDYYFSE